ncbi:energy-coupling factor transport system ATP-binding protein [Paenibacillus cellulosilyticus]|uniref:Energy-coupling factor transport system ATP-binding protein n=1 Tax=Paenibacillus cellulosilyticus TaxID=375489 RepID=A0A2V2YYI6_9BACL|nr:ATP-binding cassette domain-containing protein [Paenibacillus cellulosilyticus]PWW06486.1 energy-coupling factor transport system ATP-binding protein [Paenibacillus cellulosilyticus]QKS46173.1 ATP-binding cassette domain-containing protein [Paenibacillus cellulosilyticus]
MPNSLHARDLRVVVDGKTIVRSLTAAFKSGHITLIVGHNGAGKSTLLETLAGLREPASGVIVLEDQPLWLKRKLNHNYLMQIGVSLQQSAAQWFLPTVADEFRYSLRPYRLSSAESDARMKIALSAVGLEEEQFLHRDPKTLSGGQQRRLSIAMLAACQSKWLLLDEPTAGLDAEGTRQLGMFLQAHRDAGGSAIIVAHDLDVLLPVADAVLVLDGGIAVSSDMRSAAAYAALLAASSDKGPLPQPLETAVLLQQAGFALPVTNEAWLEPQALAAVLVSELQGQDHNEDRASSVTVSSYPAAPQAASETRAPTSEQPVQQAISKTGIISSDRFDPRAVILSYLLFATGILMQQSWIGLLIATATALAFVWWPLRYTITPWRNAVMLYAKMVLLFVLFAGIKISPIGYDWHPAMETGYRLCKLFVVMVTGLPIAALMTPIRLQRAIEQTLGWLRQVKLPIEALALTVALIFRFLPMIKQEWDRFVRIAHARGKSTTRPGKLPARMLYAILAPFMLSMLRGADEMTDALEARGYGREGGSKPTRGIVLRWSMTDSKLVAVFGILFVLFYLL